MLQLVAKPADGVGRSLGRRQPVVFLKLGHRLADDLRVGHQIGVHPLVEDRIIGLLAGAEREGGGERPPYTKLGDAKMCGAKS
jgi:hypothetical protein